jgi:hypothetical protein
MVAEALVVEVVERGAHNAEIRQEAGLHEMKHARQELASSKIAGRAEQHHDVRIEDAVAAGLRLRPQWTIRAGRACRA